MNSEIIEFVPLAKAAEECGYSEASLRRDIDKGLMPKPIQISPNRVALIRSELEEFKRRKLEAAGRDVAA